MKNKIKDYLPQKLTLVQVQVSIGLADEVKAICKKNKLTMRKVVVACLEKFRDEMKGR
jgi:hypothetical protein